MWNLIKYFFEYFFGMDKQTKESTSTPKLFPTTLKKNADAMVKQKEYRSSTEESISSTTPVSDSQSKVPIAQSEDILTSAVQDDKKKDTDGTSTFSVKAITKSDKIGARESSEINESSEKKTTESDKNIVFIPEIKSTQEQPTIPQ